jgi:hypothetical protein
LVSKFFPMFLFLKKHFALYNLYALYKFLGLGYISLGFFFVKVCIIKVVIRLMKKYHLNF